MTPRISEYSAIGLQTIRSLLPNNFRVTRPRKLIKASMRKLLIDWRALTRIELRSGPGVYQARTQDRPLPAVLLARSDNGIRSERERSLTLCQPVRTGTELERGLLHKWLDEIPRSFGKLCVN